MSPTDNYKKFENEVTFRISRVVRSFFRAWFGSLRTFFRAGRQRFTVMLIPHSEHKIFNFKISIFSIAFICILLTVMLISFVYFTTQFTGLHELINSKDDSLDNAEASLEAIRDEIYDLRRAAAVFLAELDTTKVTLGVDSIDADLPVSANGDLSSFFAIQEQDEGLIRELGDLQSLSDSMLSSVDVLKDIENVLESHRELMEDLPTLWPVPGRIRITALFGFAEHPFTGETYLHKGVDIGKAQGAPILTAANGKVIKKGHDRNGFGNYLEIQHIAGFYTKYAHLDQVLVKEGDTVVQGEQIGTMGNTGLSTGHHLHFEIRLGSQVKDPLTYLRLQDSVNVTSIQ